MSIIAFIIIILFIYHISKKRYGYTFNVNFIVSIVWATCSVLAIINPLELRQPSSIVIEYSILFLLSFNIPLFFSKIPKKSEINNKFLLKNKLYHYIIIAEFIALLMLTPTIAITIAALLSGNASDIRSAFFEMGADNPIHQMIMVNFPFAVLSSIMYLCLYLTFAYGGRRYLINAFLVTIVLTFISSGRTAIFNLLVVYLFLLLYSRANLKGRIKQSFNWKPLAIVVLGMMFVTLKYRELSTGFIDGIILYFSGSFSFLDLIISEPYEYGLDQLHYGYETFSVITEPIVYVLKVLGITDMKIPEYWLNIHVQEFQNIGDTYPVLYNNNATALYVFLLDFGSIGIIIGGLLLGCLTVFSNKRFVKGDLFGGLLFLCVFSNLLRLPMSYQGFFGVGFFIQIVVLYFFSKIATKK